MTYDPASAIEVRSTDPKVIKKEDTARRNRDLQTIVQIFMQMPLRPGAVTEIEKDMPLTDLKGKTVDVQTFCTLRQVHKAMNGDLDAFMSLVKIGDMMPKEKEVHEFITPVIVGVLPEKDDTRVLTNDEVLERARLMEAKARERAEQKAITVTPISIEESKDA